MAYPWIFLVADDHGRFEFNPRRIWTKVFGNRDDISLEDVTAWLEEYWRLGLLRRYHIDGDLAVWEGFKGRKASERRDSDYPTPEQFQQFKHGNARDKSRLSAKERGAARKIDSRAETEIETEQRQSGAESGAVAPAPPNNGLSALVVVPEIVRVPTWNQRACEVWIRFQGPVNKAHGARITNALRPLEAEHGWPIVEPLWVEALEEAAGWGDPGRFTPEVFARSFTARLRQKRGGVRAPPNPKAQAREESAVAGITGGLRGDRRRLGQGNDAARGELAGPGPDASDGEGAGG
jgi:hypothetical protein